MTDAIEKARQFGIDSFNRGESLCAARNIQFMEFVFDQIQEVGQGIPYLQAYNDAYVGEMLKEKAA